MRDLKDILEGIFDEEDNVKKLDKNVNFSSWIKKLTNSHTFEKSSKDFIHFFMTLISDSNPFPPFHK